MTREHIPCSAPLQVIAPERLEPKLATIPEQMKAFEAQSKDWEFHVESMAIMKETASFLENYGRGMGGSIGPHQWGPDVKKAADAARTRVSGYPAERRRELEGHARALVFRPSVRGSSSDRAHLRSLWAFSELARPLMVGAFHPRLCGPEPINLRGPERISALPLSSRATANSPRLDEIGRPDRKSRPDDKAGGPHPFSISTETAPSKPGARVRPR